MSLIIDMLKDLDSRHHHVNPVVQAMTTHHRYRTQSVFLNKKLWLAITLVSLSSAVVYGVIHKRNTHQLQAIPAETPVIKSENIEKISVPAEIQTVMVNSVSFSTEGTNTVVTLQLSHDTLYRITTNENNHSISLYFDNANMQTDLPTLIGSNISIKSVNAIANNGNIIFTIHTKTGASLVSANMNTTGKSPELILKIGSPSIETIITSETKLSSPAAAISTTAIGKIKTPAVQTILTEQYESAIKLAESGNKAEAMTILNKLLRFYPDYNDARVALAAIVMENGNPVDARKLIDNGLAITPDYLPLIELKARLLTSEGKVKEALLVLQSEHPDINDSPNYHALMAALYNRENNYSLAATIYQKLVGINPHESSWWFGLGVSLDKLGQNQDAVFAYSKAATEGRLNPQALAFLQNRLQILQEAAHARN